MSLRMCLVRTDRQYYVYEWLLTYLNMCFYVGKESGQRAWSYHSRNYFFRKVVAELKEKNLTPIVRIHKADLTSKETLKIERERMAFWAGRFIRLVNKTRSYRKIAHIFEARAQGSKCRGAGKGSEDVWMRCRCERRFSRLLSVSLRFLDSQGTENI
jgi:hypothetical protein